MPSAAPALSLARLGTAWGSAVVPATVEGRAVFDGTLREINARLLMHYDDINREFPDGVFDQDTVAQPAFSLYVSVADGGGREHGPRGLVGPSGGAAAVTAPSGE